MHCFIKRPFHVKLKRINIPSNRSSRCRCLYLHDYDYDYTTTTTVNPNSVFFKQLVAHYTSWIFHISPGL